ncbi:hypothetical protein pdam_00021507 [Pocillopora damicornis]|uniref:Endonuclease/exonuclease/phosphatase domain-containing protein n=1 Tax=Pocillopora damicornis TaxID=46731 RepID=A0A3M6TPK4_POCDA|nr:hypothetical protein pdam_00021507 [Pocillopora damicornis]
MLDPLPNSVLLGSLEELLPIIMWSSQKNPPPHLSIQKIKSTEPKIQAVQVYEHSDQQRGKQKQSYTHFNSAHKETVHFKAAYCSLSLTSLKTSDQSVPLQLSNSNIPVHFSERRYSTHSYLNQHQSPTRISIKRLASSYDLRLVIVYRPQSDSDNHRILMTTFFNDFSDYLETPSFSTRTLSYRKIKLANVDSLNDDLANSELCKNPPDDLEELPLSYNKTLIAVLDKHAPLVIVGDFNIHVDVLSNSDSTKFRDLLESFSLQQHVRKLFRVSKRLFNQSQGDELPPNLLAPTFAKLNEIDVT